MVMLHGWPQHWYEWRHLIPVLAGNRRVICPDLRGFGWTEAPAGGYRKEEMANDVSRLLDALDIDECEVVGHDWGAYIGFLLALREPERVRRFLGICMTPLWIDRGPILRGSHHFAYMLLLDKPLLSPLLLEHVPGFVRTVLTRGVVDRSAWQDEELEAFVAPSREPSRARAASALYRAFTTREAAPLLLGRYRAERLTVPTLLLLAQRDFAVRPNTAVGYEPYVNDMTVKVVGDAGHFVVDEKPRVVLNHVRDFFGIKEKRAATKTARSTG
jgi:pimeloyl-ACP methyl ester carboxylesterase